MTKAEQLARCAAQGMTARQAAESVGCHGAYAREAGRRHGFKYAPAVKKRGRNADEPKAVFPRSYTLLDYKECADAGLTKAETARKLGVSPCVVTLTAQRHGIEFARHDMRGRPVGSVRAKRQPSAPKIPLWLAEKIVADLAALPEQKREDYRLLRVSYGIPHDDCMAVLA